VGRILEKISLLALHGFLGQSTDWDLIQSHFMVSPFAGSFEWWSVDYMANPLLNSKNSFELWAGNFNQKVKLKFSEGPRVLIGYSLGGRLALHAFAANPEMYDHVILISTNPGLTREKERQERWLSDFAWSQKFQKMPWNELVREWNSQSVFKDSIAEPPREESKYDRELLSNALIEWSLVKQPDFREVIAQNAQKFFWISGEKDIKYISLGMELTKKAPTLKSTVIPRSSHRILFDNPSELASQMIHFLASALK
jgi:2-succinyl-6-hydroxy-2,4-cyclohexadiene-1-carboxylate synthase